MNPVLEKLEILEKENKQLKKENLLLKAEKLSLKALNSLMNENYSQLKDKKEIIKKLQHIKGWQEEKINNLHYFEDGQISALKWVLGFNEETTIQEIIERVEENV